MVTAVAALVGSTTTTGLMLVVVVVAVIVVVETLGRANGSTRDEGVEDEEKDGDGALFPPENP